MKSLLSRKAFLAVMALLFVLGAIACRGSSSPPAPATASATPSSVATAAANATATLTQLPVASSAGTATTAPSPQLSATPASPAPTPARITIVQSANGSMVQAHLGDTLLLELGTELQWTASVDDAVVLAAVSGATLPAGAQALYRASQAGAATISATGRPLCTGTGQPCPAFILPFKVTVTVLP